VAVVITGARQTIALPPAQANAIVRVAPETLRAGGSVGVTNVLSVAENVTVYALEEEVPPGLTVSNITGGGSFDAPNRKIKWGPFFDNLSRNVTYRLHAPAEAGGPCALSGIGSFDGQPVPITGQTTVTVLPNHAPVVRDDTLTRAKDQPGSVSVARLLANDSDPDGDALSLASWSPQSAQGGTVILTNSSLVYVSPPGFNGTDLFTYSASDNFGGTATATVTVTVPDSEFSQNIKRYGWTNGFFWLLFGGIPGRTYAIQATDTLNPPTWTTLATRVAAVTGEFEFIDPEVPRPPLRVYRSARP